MKQTTYDEAKATLEEIRTTLGMVWFEWQSHFFDQWALHHETPKRALLFYRTGAGKSLTSLAAIASDGYTEALVIAPPSTHDTWEELGQRIGVAVTTMSHARFRMKDTKIGRKVPIIADEFHMFGGHKAVGFKKLEAVTRALDAPMVLCSATPNYNDAERCYCIMRVLDRKVTDGGYLQFLYTNCNTIQNNFGIEPLVDPDTPFRNYKDAADYLSSQQRVYYLPEPHKPTITDISMKSMVLGEFYTYGLDRLNRRIMASIIEATHAKDLMNVVDRSTGLLHDFVYEELSNIAGDATGPVMFFCNRAEIALALQRTMLENGVQRSALVTGQLTKARKLAEIKRFRDGKVDYLIGTASLATGTDGLDKVCDTLVIVHDTQDDALRQQLMGRILPRGVDSDISHKRFYRLSFDW